MGNGFHEDFEDETFPPELFEDHYDERHEMHNSDITEEDETALHGEAFNEEDDIDDESWRDEILERQELEDFEGIDQWADSDVGGDW